MHHIETRIAIAASVQRVWALLVDFASYPGWNPFIRSIEGCPEVGQSLRVFIAPQGAKGMRFSPTVLACERHREFRWRGRLLLPGVFDGEHYFRVQGSPGGELTLFTQGEVFTGILVPLLRRSLEGATKAGFVAMNEALKREAEKP